MSRELMTMDGFADLDRRLAALGSAVATDIGEQAAQAGAEVIRDAWVKAAPYDPEEKVKSWRTKGGGVSRARYGHLRENIRVRRPDSNKATVIRRMVTTGRAFWGYFVDRGTRKMRARPWAFAAVEGAWQRAVDRMSDVIREGVEREGRRG